MRNNNTKEVDAAIDPKLARMISKVLNHPELPEKIYEALADAISETFNSDVDHQSEICDSAAYIDLVLRGYHNKKRAEPAAENVVAMRATQG